MNDGPDNGWPKNGVFSMRVVRLKNGEELGPIKFQAINVSSFTLVGNDLNLPSLDLCEDVSRDTFRERVATRVSGWGVTNYSFQYDGEVEPGKFLQPQLRPSEQQELPCTLKEIGLSINSDSASSHLVVNKLVVTVPAPGAEGYVLAVDVVGGLPKWKSFNCYRDDYQSHDDHVIYFDEEGELFLARGNRRALTIPPIDGIHGFSATRKEAIANYHPTIDKPRGSSFKNLIFATVFPARKYTPTVVSGFVWIAVYGDVDNNHNYSEDESSCYSTAEGEYDSPEIKPACQFYEYKDEDREEIPASKNPFVYFNQGELIYYTRAFHYKAYAIVNGILDTKNPYVLQVFEKMPVVAGTHNRQPGFGLRWSIRDNYNSLLTANSSESEIASVDVEMLHRDLKTIVVEKDGTQPIASYTIYNVQVDPRATPTEILELFDENNPRVCFCYCYKFEKEHPQMFLELFSTKIANGIVRELELKHICDTGYDAPKASKLPDYLKHIARADSLKKLVLQSSADLYKNIIQEYPRGGFFPSGLESLELECWDCKTHSCDALTMLKSQLNSPHLKKLVINTYCRISRKSAADFIETIRDQVPSLEEVEVKQRDGHFNEKWTAGK